MGLEDKPGKSIILNLQEEPYKGSLKVLKEKTLFCNIEKVCSPKTCRVFGSVVINEKISPGVEILLDTGASFSVISKTYLDAIFPHANVVESVRSGVTEASGREMTVIGDVVLSLRVKTEEETLELRDARFTVLDGLSAEIIIGCEILAHLKFEMSSCYAVISGKKVPRIMNIETAKTPFRIVIPVTCGIVIDYGQHKRTVLRLDLSNMVKLKPDSIYQISFLDDFTSDSVQSPDLNGRYTTFIIAPTDEAGELKTSSDLLSFNGSCIEVPKTVSGLVIGTSTGQPGACINSIQSKNLNFTNEQIEAMTQNSLLDKNVLIKLIKKNKDAFSLAEMDIGCYEEPIEIRLRDPTKEPKYSKPITYPYKSRPFVDKYIQKMLDFDLVQVSKGSQFCSPSHLIQKKNGTPRMITNFMYVNTLIVQNRWPIPSVRNVLEHLAGSQYFSAMDCKKGFWQIQITENSRSLTAFSCRGRLYEYKRLPQGMSISPGVFQSVMMKVLGEMVFQGVIVFVDDLLVYSKTKEEHYALLKRVLNRLKLAGIKLSPEKSIFGAAEVDYLGYTINRKGYEPQKAKVDSILALDIPKTKTELKSFVGTLNFYCTSLPMLQAILDPLHKISGSSSKFEWGTEQQIAFEKAKEILSNCTHLAFPSEDSHLILTTDASDNAYGGCLSELNKMGLEVPIRYFSGTFKGSEKNWIIREKELYSFYCGVKYCEELLICRSFTWRSDNKSISTLADSTLKAKTSGSPNYRVLRWLDYLNRFDFCTKLFKGTDGEMCLADTISRLTRENASINLLKMPFWTTNGIAIVDFIVAQENDDDLQNKKGVWHRFRNSEFRTTNEGVCEIRLKDKKWLPMCPESLVQNVLEYHHLPSHQSIQKMYAEIRSKLFVPNLLKHITEFNNQCVKCCRIRTHKKQSCEKVRPTTAIHPWAWGACDLVGPMSKTLDGNCYILTYVDLFSRWIEIRPLPDKSAASVLKALDSIFAVRGPCINLTGDNGREFINHLVQDYLKDLGIYWNKICPYRPQSNGHCERKNQQIKQALQFRDSIELTWDRELPSIQLEINLQKQTDGLSAYQKLHGFLLYRPAYLAYQYNENDHKKFVASESDWSRNMIQRMTRAICTQYIKENDGKVSVSDLKSSTHTKQMNQGDLVLVYFPEGSGSKLIPNWKGIYKIKEQLDRNTYAVCLQDNERKKFIVHKSRLRPVRTHFAESNNTAKQNLERAEKDSEELETNEKVDDISKETKSHEISESQAKVETDRNVPEETSRPRRKAAATARNKMKHMR